MQQFLSGDMAELSLIQLTLTEIWARFLKNVILGLHHQPCFSIFAHCTIIVLTIVLSCRYKPFLPLEPLSQLIASIYCYD